MPKRTYEKDAKFIEDANDFIHVVKDKRISWRANNSKVRRRQRRYQKRLIEQILFEHKT